MFELNSYISEHNYIIQRESYNYLNFIVKSHVHMHVQHACTITQNDMGSAFLHNMDIHSTELLRRTLMDKKYEEVENK